jgi:NhaP-type Na+/H+ or K+/H+ antiporter
MAEAGVYSYVGIALYSQIPTWWSFGFVFIMFLIIVLGRLISVFSVFYSSRLCCKRKTINFRELCFISYAGMIRGAIAFALVLKLPVTSTAAFNGLIPNPSFKPGGLSYCPNSENYLKPEDCLSN